jgi:hypothetical protein
MRITLKRQEFIVGLGMAVLPHRAGKSSGA